MPYPGGGDVSPLERDELTRRRAEARRRVRGRRRVAAAILATLVLLVVVVVAGAGGGGDEDSKAEKGGGRARADKPPELPRGGRQIFPRHRVVAYYGAPQAKELGALGIGSPDAAGRRLARQARPYRRPGQPILPAFELIAVVANGAPGTDGRYRTRQKPSLIRRYLAAARRARALLLLDIQPGRADFISEMRALEPFLREPDVGLALDPEWHVSAGQVPGQVLGSVDASVVNQVSARMAQIVRERRLPEKLLLVHQFTPGMIRGRERLARRPGVPIVLDVDGFGTKAQKVAKYRELTRGTQGFVPGLKLFYREDVGLMSPREVLRLKPQPQVVIYE